MCVWPVRQRAKVDARVLLVNTKAATRSSVLKFKIHKDIEEILDDVWTGSTSMWGMQ